VESSVLTPPSCIYCGSPDTIQLPNVKSESEQVFECRYCHRRFAKREGDNDTNS
jgi:transposase-like protein